MKDKFDIFNVQLTKFQEVLAEHQLTCEFRTDRYPIELEVKRDTEADNQGTLFNSSEASSADARLILTFFLTGVAVEIVGRFVISENLMNKIKSNGKKLRDAYLQAFFATFKDSDSAYSRSAIREIEDDEFEEDMTEFEDFLTDDTEDSDN